MAALGLTFFTHNEVNNMRLTNNLGMLLLAIWLILTGLIGLTSISIPGIIMAILALVAGILILIGR